MAACPPIRGKGRGRGVLALTSYEPCPRPSPETVGNWHDPKPISKDLEKLNIEKAVHQSAVNSGTRLKTNSSQATKTNVHINGSQNNKDIRSSNGQINDANQVINNRDINASNSQNNGISQGNNNRDIRSSNTKDQSNGTNNHIEKEDIAQQIKKNLECADMIAKYNYVAKPGAPGGFEELTIKQGEKLTLIRKGHDETNNPHWWEVKTEEGKQGYVPANRCFMIDKAPTALPWLENKRLVEEEERKKKEAELEKAGGSSFGAPPSSTAPKVRPYVSSYADKNAPPPKTYVSAYGDKNAPPPRTSVEASKQYYCQLCDKNLNGPQPYKMHMSSKAHREEEEYQNSLKK